MKNPNEKNKIVQDVIPPKRSIRNIEPPVRREKLSDDTFVYKQEAKPREVEIKMAEPIPEQKPAPFQYKYDYGQPKKYSKKWFYIGAGILGLVVIFTILNFFKSAEIRLTPKQDSQNLNSNFTAEKNNSSAVLSFQIVTVAKDMEKTVEAGSEARVDKKARGTIVIYNNWGKTSQNLVATTRFETPEGLIFRLINPVTVPGQQVKDGKTIAGSVEVLVEADKPGESYNIGLKDFTIPGFKGDPKYSKIYGRSKTAMSGGFSGMQKVVSKEALDTAEKEMENSLKETIVKEIRSQIPANFVLYSTGLSYNFENITQVFSSNSKGAVLKKVGVGKAVIFDRNVLTKAIISKIMPDSAEGLRIKNLDLLEFAFQSNIPSDTDTSISFSLKGQVEVVWLFDENKLQSDILGLSKTSAKAIIATYPSIREAWITTRPFWNQKIPSDTEKVTIVNTVD